MASAADSQHPSPSSEPARRVAAVIAGGLCVAGAVAIWGLIVGHFDTTSGRVLGSALAAALATLCELAGSTVLGRGGRRSALGRATILVSGVALILVLILIWVPAADSGSMFRAFGVSVAAMLACAHGSLLYGWLRPNDARGVVALARVAVGCASTAALVVGGLLLFVPHATVAPAVWRLLGVLVVIAVLATLLAPLTRRMGRSRPPRAGGAPHREPSNGLG